MAQSLNQVLSIPSSGMMILKLSFYKQFQKNNLILKLILVNESYFCAGWYNEIEPNKLTWTYSQIEFMKIINARTFLRDWN